MGVALGAMVALLLVTAMLMYPHGALWVIPGVAAAAAPLISVCVLRRRLLDSSDLLEKSRMAGRRARKRIDYLESILQDSTDIIFTLEVEGYILKFNRGSEIHFGYSQEEIVGKPFSQLFRRRRDSRKILASVRQAGKATHDEIPMISKDGKSILVNLSIAEMRNETGGVMGLVVIARDITEKKKLTDELKRKNELLNQLAITDGLTGLYNVRHFRDQVSRELKRLGRSPDHKLSVILIDIDHFKDLNDTMGHQTGDYVLLALAQVVKVCIRVDIDSGYRYGGDEFLIILPDTDQSEASVVARRIQRQFGAFKFGRTSLSVGITEASTNDDDESIFRRVDKALYESKVGGRNRISFSRQSFARNHDLQGKPVS